MIAGLGAVVAQAKGSRGGAKLERDLNPERAFSLLGGRQEGSVGDGEEQIVPAFCFSTDPLSPVRFTHMPVVLVAFAHPQPSVILVVRRTPILWQRKLHTLL